jgi:hypothetical protein
MISMIVTQRYVGEEGHCRPGRRIIARNAARAQQLIEMNLARLEVPPAGPANNKALGPAQNKTEATPNNPAQHEEKKSAGVVSIEAATGPLIDSSTPGPNGAASPAPSSPVAPASPRRRPRRSRPPAIAA